MGKINKNLALIGCGNMGQAILRGLIQAEIFDKEQILVAEPNEAAAASVADAYGVKTVADAKEAVLGSEILLFAVKPNVLPAVLEKNRSFMSEDQLLISIAAGTPIKSIEDACGRPMRIVRCMPNLPALVGASMNALSFNDRATEEDKETAQTIFSGFGLAEQVPESLMDAVVGVSGSSPAYVFMLIEAMADAAVADGMPRAQAYRFAAQSVMGSAKMVLETGRHPADLKDAVCSPGGTTIEAVAKLEKKGFRSTVIEAQRACAKKSASMAKKKK